MPIAPTLQDPTEAVIAVSLSGIPKKIGASNRLRNSAPSAEGSRHRYQKKIEAFIDQLQARLGLENDDEDEQPRLSLTDAALLSLDAMQASIARCMLAAYPPDLLIEVPINTCGAHEFYRAREVIAHPDTELLFSAASSWEIAIKATLGREDFRVEPRLLRRGLLDNGYVELPITSLHAVSIDGLPSLHNDPFDRLLLAQAVSEGITLLTSDVLLARYAGPVRKV